MGEGGGGEANGKEGKKREKFDDIKRWVSVCDRSLKVIPMASYSSPDTATNCSDVLTVTKWPTHTSNWIVKVLAQMLGAMYAI